MKINDEKERKGRFGEILLIATATISAFTVLSLISYSEKDILLASGYRNWCGVAGVLCAHYLYRLLGFSVFILLFTFMLFPIIFLLKSQTTMVFGKFSACLSSGLGIAGLLHLFVGRVKIGHLELSAGGSLGNLIADHLRQWVGTIGTSLILVSLVLILLVAGADFSLRDVYFGLIRLGKVFGWLIKRTFGLVGPRFTAPERGNSPADPDRNHRYQEGLRETTVPPVIVAKPLIVADHKKEDEFQDDDIDEQISHLDRKISDRRLDKGFQLPPLEFLKQLPRSAVTIDSVALQELAELLQRKLNDFNILGRVVNIQPGPVITLYEYELAPDIKLKQIVNLGDDLAMRLGALCVRITALPGKSTVGIEIPNKTREIVYLWEVLSSETYQASSSVLTLGLGKSIDGRIFLADLRKMPHLLMAGATGTGKSVAINAIIASILYKASPKEVRFILIDPKMLELKIYEGIPHLLLPVVTDPKKAANTLRWCVKEMMRRYSMLAEVNAKDIDGYNRKTEARGDENGEHLPYIVVIIDELADLMLVASKDIEDLIARLAQMARAAGIHVILATQTPRAEVITGLIKANFKARISFGVSSKLDSRVILDAHGAETLLGMGDMLYLSPDYQKLKRIHGAYISENEIEEIATFLSAQAKPDYIEEAITAAETEQDEQDDSTGEGGDIYDRALEIVKETKKASASYLQRRLKIGYNRAARIIERMEEEGFISSQDGIKHREVYLDRFK